jgi:hypothetical protein
MELLSGHKKIITKSGISLNDGNIKSGFYCTCITKSQMFSYCMTEKPITYHKNVCVGNMTCKLHHLHQKVFTWSAHTSSEAFVAVKIKRLWPSGLRNCSFINSYKYFGETYCFHFQGNVLLWNVSKHVPDSMVSTTIYICFCMQHDPWKFYD